MAQEGSNPHSPLDLPDGLYLVTRRIPQIACVPYDSLTVERSHRRLPYILQRHLDHVDLQMMLSASAIQVVPDPFWETIPSRAEIRRRGRIVLTRTKAGAVTERSILRLVR